MTNFTFSRQQLTELLQHDVVPGLLTNTWNSLVVNRQIDSICLMPWESIRRTEYMNSLIQNGEKEKIYHGKKSNLIPNDLIENADFINVSSGFAFERSLMLTVGINRLGTIALPEAIGILSPGPLFPTKDGIKKKQALSVHVDYNNAAAMPVKIYLSPLGLSDPETTEQATDTLKIIGSAVAKIKQGVPCSFEYLRQNLIDNAGLIATDSLEEGLKDTPKTLNATPTLAL